MAFFVIFIQIALERMEPDVIDASLLRGILVFVINLQYQVLTLRIFLGIHDEEAFERKRSRREWLAFLVSCSLLRFLEGFFLL